MTNAIKQKTKYSGVEWFGNVPEDWQVKKLKFVFKYFTGGTPDSGKEKYYAEDGLNWITITDLDGKFTSESKNKITELAVKDKNMKIAPVGSLLYSFKLSVGQMAFVSQETYTNEAIFAILPDKDINLDFWYYALQCYLIENANENIYGAKIFNQPLIDNSLLLVPSPSAQKEIGKYLGIKTEQIKKFIDNKIKLISLLEEQKKTVIHNAITKGLDRNIKTKFSGIEWIGDIPEDWKVFRLKFLGNIVNGSTPSSSEKDYYDGDIDWITPTDLGNSNDPRLFESQRKITKLGLESCGTTLVPKNSIIISCRAPIGSLGITTKEMCTNQGCKTFIPNNLVNYEYAYNHFVAFNEYLQSLGRGTTFQELPTPEFGDSKFLLPPLPTQIKIVEHIKNETSKIDQAIHTVQQEIELIEEYKKSLIYQVVTGKIETLLTNK